MQLCPIHHVALDIFEDKNVCHLCLKDEAGRPHESILLEADKLVNGDRNHDYGHPLDDFTKTAKFWTAYLQSATGTSIVITAEDVPMLMILLKMARELNMPKRDNKIDMAGYAATLQMRFDERERRNKMAD